MSAKLSRSTGIASFWRGFLRGLGSPAEVFMPPGIALPYSSDAEALRNDWKNIGRDFRAAIRYERDALAGSR